MSTVVFDPHVRGGHVAAAATPITATAAGLAVGLAALAFDRIGLRGSRNAAVAIGLTAGMVEATGRALAPSVDALGRFGRATARMPVVGGPVRAGSRRWNAMVVRARDRGTRIVADGRAQATRLVRDNVADSMGWVRAEVAPQLVDDLVPHLVDRVMPRLINGALPEIRLRVMPVVIEDLSNDPRIRDMVLDQSRGALTDATRHVHSTAARADDQVESAVQRLFGRRAVREPVPPGPVEN